MLRECSSNIFDEHSCFIDLYFFSRLCRLPPCSSSFPVFIDILLPNMCPYGDASGKKADSARFLILSWGCAKGAVKRACRKTVVQTPRNGQLQVVNQKPAARLPRKGSHLLDQGHLRFQIQCARCLWTENVLFGTHRRIAKTRPLWLGQGYHGWQICASNFLFLIWNRTHALPW